MPNYADVFADLKDQPYNTFDGVNYGIPHGRGANLLMWNTDDVKPDTDVDGRRSSTREAAKYSGKISAYDDPIYIADAAVYLKAHQPDLGIDNPYELDEDQFNAAVDLLKQQRAERRRVLVATAPKQISSFANGDDEVGTTWQYQYFTLKGDGQPIASSPASDGLPPGGGRDRVVGHLDAQLEAAHPNCMYLWMNHITRSEGRRRQVAEWFGEAPANEKACARVQDLEPGVLRGSEALRELQRGRPGVLEARLLLEHAARRLRRRPRRRRAWTTTTGSRPGPRSRGSR